VDDPRSLFAPEEIERARAYHRPLYVAWPARLAIDVVVLAAIAFSRFGNELFGALDDLSWWSQTLAYTVVATGVTALLTLPISFAAGYLRERAWGFSTQSTRGWFADRAKGLGVAVVLGCVVMLGFVGLARALPRSWPFAAAAAAAALVVLLTFVAPLILEPMFNRFSPLEDAELAESLRRLSEDAGVPIEQVLVADASRRTTKQNAYVSGLGRTRRLVLFDTLLADAERRELRLVLAHELGHRRARHIAQGTALGIAGAIAFVVLLWALLRWQPLLDALGVTGPGDPRIVPFVLLLGIALQGLGAPLGALVSRIWERQADRISLELTSDPAAFESMMRRLALANLADLDPPRLAYVALFTHPTPPERIGAARKFGAGAAGRPHPLVRSEETA
jgi:STE24 endopeptidase